MIQCSAALRSRVLVYLRQLGLSCLIGLAVASGAAAQAADVRAQPSARDTRRSFQLDDGLIEEAHRAYVWRVAWTAIYGGLALGAIAAVPVFPDSDAPSLWIGAISSGVSAVFSWFFPIEVEASTGALLRMRDPHGSPLRRARVNAIYVSASADEQSRVSWPWHALNAVLALIPGIVLWLGYDQFSSGLLQFGAGVLLGEAALFTQPTELRARPAQAGGLRGLTITF